MDLPGFPHDLVAVDAGASSVSLRVDATAYSLDALYGASYIFIDRCYVLLDKADASWRVTLSWKKGEPTPDQLRALVGEFANELLSCAWRAKIAQESRAVIESVTAQALGGAMGPPIARRPREVRLQRRAVRGSARHRDVVGGEVQEEGPRRRRGRSPSPAAQAADTAGAAEKKA